VKAVKVFVTGGFSRSRPEDEAPVRTLGRAIASAGHTIVQGYSNAFDRAVAEAAFEVASTNGKFPKLELAVQSFLTEGQDSPEKAPWLVRRLPIRDWDLAQENWSVPEPIQNCDVAIVMGGGPKTLRSVNLCRLAKKPIVPVTGLKGAAIEIFKAEMDRFSEFYEGRVSKDQYSLLDTQNPGDFTAVTREAVLIATQLAVGNLVFVVMAFREETEDAYTAITELCKDRKLKCERTDKDPTTNRIYQRIVNGIQRASLVIADVSVGTLNVYYELGYAEALGKPVVVIAKEGTDLPFDTRDLPATLYRNQTRLKEALGKRIDELMGFSATS
jgi:Nucleoside 2-deoxyribosyltransferase